MTATTPPTSSLRRIEAGDPPKLKKWRPLPDIPCDIAAPECNSLESCDHFYHRNFWEYIPKLRTSRSISLPPLPLDSDGIGRKTPANVPSVAENGSRVGTSPEAQPSRNQQDRPVHDIPPSSSGRRIEPGDPPELKKWRPLPHIPCDSRTVLDCNCLESCGHCHHPNFWDYIPKLRTSGSIPLPPLPLDSEGNGPKTPVDVLSVAANGSQANRSEAHIRRVRFASDSSRVTEQLCPHVVSGASISVTTDQNITIHGSDNAGGYNSHPQHNWDTRQRTGRRRSVP
ncbi:hypothetical protein BU17DRAFT_88557 [Hysterangium stoloniferum]|nr:hypothetical protein BU17DRAFT_88557 [Hysterangium stoloniferum]